MDVINVDPAEQFILSLCAGGGGLDLGVKLAVPGARTVGYVEIEAFACATLVRQMEAGGLDAAPVWTDLHTFRGRKFRGVVDGLIGGYPCQPFSVAGRLRGADDPRHLWPIIRRNIRIIRPRWCFFENVANHLRLGFDDVARDFHALGYDVAAGVFSAAEVGARQERKRLFILAVANASRQRCEGERVLLRTGGSHAGVSEAAGGGTAVVNTDGTRLEGWGRPRRERADERPAGAPGQPLVHPPSERRREGRSHPIVGRGWDALTFPIRAMGEWPADLPAAPPGPHDDAGWRHVLARWPEAAPAIESDVRRMAHGMAYRLDRLRLLGNGVVPAQAAYAFRCLATDLSGVAR